ncbi:MAG: glycine cleavage system protein H [Candidatus Abyssobacteria bacterium SURF_17]|jgi:glycine cleavage system H lipoate-binding protein|uniref:Glycine cleavage system protein H n=1 Tax=Candidatus Abyssobacteria bacterium SURF_17 TaxID=2093361 RepID=A0A419EQ03_9BACT|nr:MAG: glycine cleavage system protein H [Candidatus Abyssubacteria bacterium SURF_17]
MALILAVLTMGVFVAVSLVSELMKKRILPKTVSEGFALQAAVAGLPEIAEPPAVVVLPTAKGSTPRIEGYLVPRSLYYHQGHAWVALQKSGSAVIGVDDFTSKLVGTPDSIILPRVGQRCYQGEKGWTISAKGKCLDMLFPLDGEVVAVNRALLENPGLLAKEPYGNGWLVMVKTRNPKRNLRNLLFGSVAKRWIEESAFALRFMFSGKLGIVLPDGGLPVEGAVDYFSEEDWKELSVRLFTNERTEDDSETTL